MSRDDSALYTGASSASFGTPRQAAIKEKRDQKKQERLDNKTKLTPAAQVINEIIDREKALVVEELANLPMNANTTEESLKALLVGYQRNLVFIRRLQTEINKTLRETA